MRRCGKFLRRKTPARGRSPGSHVEREIAPRRKDRKRVGEGERGDFGGRRIIKKKKSGCDRVVRVVKENPNNRRMLALYNRSSTTSSTLITITCRQTTDKHDNS